MRSKSDISQTDFVAACCTVAAVLADGWWQTSRGSIGPIKRLESAASAALDCQAAAKHCGFGRTRFRELVAAGVFPAPVTIAGRKRWLARDLDLSLMRLSGQRLRGK